MQSPRSDEVWGAEVSAGDYAGHSGLLYRQRPRTFAELLTGAHRWWQRTFLVQGDRRVTFGEFFTALGTARERLHRLDIEPGDRVVLLAYNSPDWVLALWAIWSVGAVPVLGNRWWSPREAAHSLELVAPRAIITDAPDLTDGCGAPVLDIAGFSTFVGSADVSTFVGSADVSTFVGSAEVALPDIPGPHDEDDAAVILFTSGSSGMPKAVELSFRAVAANQHNVLARARQLPHLLPADAPQPVNLICTPLFHIGAFATQLTQTITGGRIVFNSGRFDPGQVLAIIEAEGVQRWGAVPTMAVRLLEHPDFESYDLSTLRSFPMGGAPVPPVLLEKLARRLPQLARRGLANMWGMTEGGGFLTLAAGADLERFGDTVGRPLPTVELAIDHPDDNGVGEVLVRSPTVMTEYLGIDSGTVDSDGWLHTGDLGRLNPDGYLFIVGRSKDMVIRGGENIACPHVEAALLRHPDVVEAAVIGLPHPELGEELAAIVVYRVEATPPSEEDLAQHLQGLIAYFAIPTKWRITAAPLPTIAGEKIDKKGLAVEFA